MSNRVSPQPESSSAVSSRGGRKSSSSSLDVVSIGDSPDIDTQKRRPDGSSSPHDMREYLSVVLPGERLTSDAVAKGVQVVDAERAASDQTSFTTDEGGLSPTAASGDRTGVAGFHGRKANMSTPSPRPNSGKYHGQIIGADNSPHENGCCTIILTVLSYILVIMFFPVSLCATIKVVQEYERAVIFRLGRLLPGGAKGPGIFFVMPCIEEYSKVDLRTVSFDVPPQEVLTRDSVTVSVDAVVYYRISSPTVSVANVENAANSTQLLAQTTLRNVLGTQNLSEILSNREHISEQMQNVLDDATDKWGIKVERVEIKDVRLPTQLQRAMAAEAEAARDARAKVIAAEGEQKASFALKEAADIIGASPAALQLRYLQTLSSISAEKNSTIIFPVPIELMTGFLRK